MVAEWSKNVRETVRANLGTFNGRDLASLRVYVPSVDRGLLPTARGISIRIDQLPALPAAVGTLCTAAGIT